MSNRLSYEEARAYMHTVGLGGVVEWQEWCASGKKPKTIPNRPDAAYKGKGWKGYGDFLGTGRIAPKNIDYLPFEKVKEFARGLDLRSKEEWFTYSKNNKKPYGIPATPNRIYKDEWIDWADFLGNGFLTFEEAREYVRGLGLTGRKKWVKYCTSDQKPDNIPSSPDIVYKEKGWKDWNDFLGYSKVEFLSYEKAREYARELGLTSSVDWINYCKEGKKPNNIPYQPHKAYNGKGWESWGDFLGYGFLSFEEAREYVRNIEIDGFDDWKIYCKSGQKPGNIPSNPNQVYGQTGWMGYSDFLGYKERKYVSFQKAKEFVKGLCLESYEQWRTYCKSGNKPKWLPGTPETVYRDSGWKGIVDFLGYMGNGNHRWDKSTLIAFLNEIQPNLHLLSDATLITIIEANGLNGHISVDDLQKVQKTKAGSVERMNILSSIINDIAERDTSEFEESPEIQYGEGSLREVEIDGDSLINTLDSIYGSQINEINQLGFLLSLDNEVLTAALDTEKVNFIISESINNLWYSILSNKITIQDIEQLSLKKEIPLKVTKRFIQEYYEVVNMELPEGWIYPHAPLLMQKLISHRISQNKRYGNWSSVGSGKTIGAILAGRYVGAKNTLIITFNSTISNGRERGWIKEINDSFTNSKVWTKNNKNISFDNDSHNYLIFNYESFQQKESSNLVKKLVEQYKFDYIILDEVQSVKRRDFKQSKRRINIMKLIGLVKEMNPDYYLHVMSATPVINNLTEGQSIIELIELDNHKPMNVRETVKNCMELHRRLTNCGIRYKDEKHNILINNSYTLLDVKADHLFSDACNLRNDDFLKKDQLVLDSKLDAILPYVNTSKGKTIIYTYFVDEIDERIYYFLTQRGFKVGIYTGSRSKFDKESALDDFINGDIDVLVSSRPIGTGVDGLQKVSDRMIILSLPYTNSELVQLVGRISRQGSNFAETGVDVIIPLVTISHNNQNIKWDHKKYNIITYKETIANAVVDGIIPDKIIKSKEDIISLANDCVNEWKERLEEESVDYV